MTHTTEQLEAMLAALTDERNRLATAHKQLMQSLDAANARADQARDAALVEAADIILADNYDDPDSAAHAIPAIDPAAIREAALREAIKSLRDWQANLNRHSSKETAITVGMAADVVEAMIGEKK